MHRVLRAAQRVVARHGWSSKPQPDVDLVEISRMYSTAAKSMLKVDDVDEYVRRAYGNQENMDFVKRKLRRALESPVEAGNTPEQLSESERRVCDGIMWI